MESQARSGELRVEDVREWALRADELDELDAASTLWAATGFLGLSQSEGQRVGVARSLNFLLMGRAQEAGAALVEGRCVRGDRAEVDAALDATAAAIGDSDAWIRLVNGVVQFPGVLTILLLAAAAECRGDQTTADSAWLTLRDTLGRRSGLVVARAAVADITRSIGSNERQARGRVLYRNAVALSGVRGGLRRDPRWALDAIQRLESRHDNSGARLLAETLTEVIASPPQRLVDASSRLTPQQAMRRYRTWMTIVLVTAFAFIWLGILWLALVLVGWTLIDRFVRVPGFSLEDGRTWRRLRPRVVGAGYGPGAASLSGGVALIIATPVVLISAYVALVLTNPKQPSALLNA